MNRSGLSELRRAVALLPSGHFVMTAAFDSKRQGVSIESVHKCGDEPLLICIPCRKGHPIEPLIRDSHRFAVCQLDPADRLLVRRFDWPRNGDDRYDPFDSLEVDHLQSNAPILKRAILALDCEVFRHFDLEADQELYVGLVVAARVNVPGGGATVGPVGGTPGGSPNKG